MSQLPSVACRSAIYPQELASEYDLGGGTASVLIVEWSRVFEVPTCSLSRHNNFEFKSRHVRRLPLTPFHHQQAREEQQAKRTPSFFSAFKETYRLHTRI